MCRAQKYQAKPKESTARGNRNTELLEKNKGSGKSLIMPVSLKLTSKLPDSNLLQHFYTSDFVRLRFQVSGMYFYYKSKEYFFSN